MITGIFKKFFGSRNDRLIKQYRKTVAQINALEADLVQLSEQQLRDKTQDFRARIALV